MSVTLRSSETAVVSALEFYY